MTVHSTDIEIRKEYSISLRDQLFFCVSSLPSSSTIGSSPRRKTQRERDRDRDRERETQWPFSRWPLKNVFIGNLSFENQ